MNKTGEMEELAINLHRVLAAVIDNDVNVIITPGREGVSVRLESSEKITAFFLHTQRVAQFNQSLKTVYEPLEKANAMNSNKMYLIGVAVERVLRDQFLLFEGPKSEIA
jgi:hypothetical protein